MIFISLWGCLLCPVSTHDVMINKNNNNNKIKASYLNNCREIKRSHGIKRKLVPNPIEPHRKSQSTWVNGLVLLPSEEMHPLPNWHLDSSFVLYILKIILQINSKTQKCLQMYLILLLSKTMFSLLLPSHHPSKANAEQTASGYVPIISFKSLSFKREQLCCHKTIIPKALKLWHHLFCLNPCVQILPENGNPFSTREKGCGGVVWGFLVLLFFLLCCYFF